MSTRVSSRKILKLQTRLTLRAHIANGPITDSTSYHLLPAKFPMTIRFWETSLLESCEQSLFCFKISQ